MPLATQGTESIAPLHIYDILPFSLEGERNLSAYLDAIWERYFADVPRVNDVYITYCYPWKSRLGLIRLALDNSHSLIGVNTLLQHQQVPLSLLITTIAHELVHYAHGFGSPLPRLYEHPHADGIVERELEQRSLGDYLQHSNTWIDEQWYPFYERQRALGWSEVIGPRRSIRRVKATA